MGCACAGRLEAGRAQASDRTATVRPYIRKPRFFNNIRPAFKRRTGPRAKREKATICRGSQPVLSLGRRCCRKLLRGSHRAVACNATLGSGKPEMLLKMVGAIGIEPMTSPV